MKKSAFLTFVCSFIPGCGLMYLGYLKKGLQYMLMFAAASWMSFLMADLFWHLRGGWAASLFIITLPVIWFFQFFDTMHTRSRMKRLETDFPTDDGFFYPQNLFTNFPLKKISAAKSFAYVLITVGIMWLFSLIMDMSLRYMIDEVRFYLERVNQYMFPVLISVALIAAGIHLLKSKKK